MDAKQMHLLVSEVICLLANKIFILLIFGLVVFFIKLNCRFSWCRQASSANRRWSGAQEMFSWNSADFVSGVRLTRIIPFRKALDLTSKTHRFATM